MAEYIERQAAIDEIRSDPMGGLNYKRILTDIPAADVVPVVRCKDCKHVHCRIYHGWQEPIYTCTHLRSRWNTDNDLEVNPDGFCSYGEKKE